MHITVGPSKGLKEAKTNKHPAPYSPCCPFYWVTWEKGSFLPPLNEDNLAKTSPPRVSEQGALKSKGFPQINPQC